MIKRILLLLSLTALAASGEGRINLAGKWERWIGGQFHDVIDVPSSYRPIGTAVLRRTVELPPLSPAHRMLLRFEGVAHHAEVRLNDKTVGSMGPWTPYDFDVTDQVRSGVNRLDVEVTDWQVPLGPIGAWEASGGIIHDVYFEARPDAYVANAHLQYKLTSDFGAANCDLNVFLTSTHAVRGKVTAELMLGSLRVSEASRDADVPAGESTVALNWALKAPQLWSPATPNLYSMRVRLTTPGGEDVFVSETGFRDLQIRGNKFLLNGQDLVLRGICRHEIWKDQGHTLTQAQIEQDLTMIKAMGANFVRLVHYPHDRREIAAANRIGLLVTEESGLVWLLSHRVAETSNSRLEMLVTSIWTY